jgi:hypothetical protein
MPVRVREQSDLVVIISRIIEACDPSRILRACIRERGDHDETSQYDQGKERQRSSPAPTPPPTHRVVTESVEESEDPIQGHHCLPEGRTVEDRL